MNIGEFLRRNSVPLVLLTGVSGLIGLILYPAFAHATFNARRSTCQSSLHDIMRACLEYQIDYEGHYPPLSDGNSRGWSQILRSHESSLKFSCPEGYRSSFSPSSDYFFNARFARRKETSISDPALSIAFGEGIDNGPSNSHYMELPNDGGNPNSVLRRHYFGSNYAFADGHVQMLMPERANERWHDETGRQDAHINVSGKNGESAKRR